MKKFKDILNITEFGILELFLLAIFSSCLLHHFYFLIAPWVWNQNTAYPVSQLTPWIIGWTKERDGVEIYALYLLMFIGLFISFMLFQSRHFLSKPLVRCVLIIGLILLSVWHFLSIKFIPPLYSINLIFLRVLYFALAVFLLTALYFRKKKRMSGLLEIPIAILVLIPVCFIATEPIAAEDYSYIFLPAQKLMSGVAISNIYFQYDVFLSFLALGWMRLGFDLEQFQILGQLSYLVAFLGIYLMSKKLFLNKSLCLFLFCSLILVRIYATPWDVVRFFQVTPLRLDLWLVPFVMIFFLGAFHWSIGLVCGLLIIFHRNCGIIWSISYIQLVLTLGIIYIIDNRNSRHLVDAKHVVCFLKKGVAPIVIIFLSYMLSQFMFSRNAEATAYYQKIGIGFIPIAKTSFFWYYPIIMSVTFILLFTLRSQVADKYIALGFFLVYCAIGNSIYFFGRSHENNILNISISLVFLFFYCLDLIDRKLNINSSALSREDGRHKCMMVCCRKHAMACLGILSVALASYYYSGSIARKLAIQFKMARVLLFNRAIAYPSHNKEFIDFVKDIKLATNNSKAVQFIDSNPYAEYLFYRYGKYSNMFYFSPVASCVFMNDLIRHMQGLIDKGYYLLLRTDLYNGLFRTCLPNADKVLYYTKNKNLTLIFASSESLEHRYQTALSEGILFNQEKFPDFVAGVKGVSGRRALGRYTNGEQVIIDFSKKLPNRFVLKIKAGTVLSIVDKPINVRIGSTQLVTHFGPNISEVVIPVVTDGEARSIIFEIPESLSETKLGVNENNHRLDLFLVSLQIEK